MLIPMSTGLVYPRGAAGWDISTATYSGVSFDASAQVFSEVKIAFNFDGTKMYLSKTNSDVLYQYSLSTAWDLSTASYDSVSFSVGSQASNPTAFFFKVDGTKLYVGCRTTDSVYQYSLSTAWDLSTASYDSVSFGISSQVASVRGISFKPDGLSLYLLDTTTDSVYQYSLSTAWDLSTASYDSVSFSVGSQDTDPVDLFFKPDGSLFFMLGGTGDSVYQYSLSTAWDLSTASYDSVSYTANEPPNPSGLFFSDVGVKMYVVDQSNTRFVYEYNLG